MLRLIEERRWRTALLVAHEVVNRIIHGWASGGGLKTIGASEQDFGRINVFDLDISPREDGARLQIERAILKAVNVTPCDYLKGGLPRTNLERLFDVDFGAARPPRP
jgi:probable phosphoglycerate mutase